MCALAYQPACFGSDFGLWRYQAEVIAMLQERGGAMLTDESRGYLHFAAKTGSEERMSKV